MIKKLIILILVLAFGQYLMLGSALAESSSTSAKKGVDQPTKSSCKSAVKSAYYVERFVISNGIVEGSFGGETIYGTIGQPIIGTGTFGANSITYGFMAEPVDQGCCIGIRGNITLEPVCDYSDQTVDIADLTNLISALFINFEPICCLEEADISPTPPDGVVDIGDLTGLIDYLFITNPPLQACP